MAPIVPFEPRWWTGWIENSNLRVHRGSDPYQIDEPGQRKSTYILKGVPDSGGDALGRVRGLIESFIEIQAGGKPSALVFGVSANFTDLETRTVHLDGDIIETCPYRPGASFPERLDIFSGIALHEAMHLECSDPGLCFKAKQKGTLFAQLHNLIEDEFVELILARASPGYADYVIEARDYLFGDAHQAMVTNDDSLLNALLLFIRSPKRLTWTDVARHALELEQVSEILTPFPSTPEEVFKATEKIHDLLLNSENHRTGPQTSPGLDSFLATLDSHVSPEAGLPPFLQNRGPRPRLRAEALSRHKSSLERGRKLFWQDAVDNRRQYTSDRAAVKPYVRRLQRWLKAQQQPFALPDSGTVSGSLDPARLHRAPLNDPRLFKRRVNPAVRRLAIGLLVDESASMRGPKVQAARKVAVLFHEALKSMENIELFIYGHTADVSVGSTNIYRYVGPGNKNRYSLGSITARKNNRDGVAIKAVAEEVRRSTSCPEIVLLVVSDGQPNAEGYKDRAAVEHTRSAVRELGREMRVIQIAIDPVVESARMFDHYVRFTDIGSLPGQMTSLLKKLLRF